MNYKLRLLLLIFSLFLIKSCTEKNDLSYPIYDKNGFIKADGKFKRDQFIDTIYVYKEKDNDVYNDHFDTFIKIDSSKDNYFYGTETVEEKNTHKLFSKGIYRFKKSSDPKECYQSKLKTGYFEFHNIDGSLYSKKQYKIKGDSSYVVEN
ncbi:hypothetical protein J3D55_004147 [Chryseobacterium ginsenosidimutans]|uniref:hypothetical protein n=1 Tax=Chryseobacterium ginsenosidimutans TaxID=687846 RepID=UPI00216898E8|nr:hypothetical protein [Chryseobacterium ginsenosidimutans]MCS3871231.1 hypothetical protein [Chryseobacterium ginsenosidimutans]